MVIIEFNYHQIITTIPVKLSDLFRNVIDKFNQRNQIPQDSVYFIINGMLIKPERTVENYMRDRDKIEGKMKILVVDI